MDAPKSTADVRLDCRGLLCPLPVYKAGLALGKMSAGEVLELTTTDPGSIADVPAMARQRGDRLISSSEGEGVQVFLVEKGGAR